MWVILFLFIFEMFVFFRVLEFCCIVFFLEIILLVLNVICIRMADFCVSCVNFWFLVGSVGGDGVFCNFISFLIFLVFFEVNIVREFI